MSADEPTVAYLNEISVTCYKCAALLQRGDGCVLIMYLNCGRSVVPGVAVEDII
jgi:hypothetical protein